MNVSQNKQIAKSFIEASVQRDAARIAQLMRDDMTYWINGKLPRFARVWTKPEYCALLNSPTPFREGVKLTIGEFFAEGDRVVIEAEISAVITESGKIYNNHYCWLFTIRDGQIAQIREYTDTQHTNEILPLPPV